MVEKIIARSRETVQPMTQTYPRCSQCRRLRHVDMKKQNKEIWFIFLYDNKVNMIVLNSVFILLFFSKHRRFIVHMRISWIL